MYVRVDSFDAPNLVVISPVTRPVHDRVDGQTRHLVPVSILVACHVEVDRHPCILVVGLFNVAQVATEVPQQHRVVWLQFLSPKI